MKDDQNLVAKFVAFYDSKKPVTCEEPDLTPPIMTLTIGSLLAYLGETRPVTYFRVINAKGDVLAQGEPHDLEGYWATLITGCPYSIKRLKFVSQTS